MTFHLKTAHWIIQPREFSIRSVARSPEGSRQRTGHPRGWGPTDDQDPPRLRVPHSSAGHASRAHGGAGGGLPDNAHLGPAREVGAGHRRLLEQLFPFRGYNMLGRNIRYNILNCTKKLICEEHAVKY